MFYISRHFRQHYTASNAIECYLMSTIRKVYANMNVYMGPLMGELIAIRMA